MVGALAELAGVAIEKTVVSDVLAVATVGAAAFVLGWDLAKAHDEYKTCTKAHAADCGGPDAGGCKSNAKCAPGVCAADGHCVQCVTDADCAADRSWDTVGDGLSVRPRCLAGNTCVECLQDADCTAQFFDSVAARCEPTTHLCRDCMGDADCKCVVKDWPFSNTNCHHEHCGHSPAFCCECTADEHCQDYEVGWDQDMKQQSACAGHGAHCVNDCFCACK